MQTFPKVLAPQMSNVVAGLFSSPVQVPKVVTSVIKEAKQSSAADELVKQSARQAGSDIAWPATNAFDMIVQSHQHSS